MAILVLYSVGRRRYAGAEGILEEIQEAETGSSPSPLRRARCRLPRAAPARPRGPPGGLREASLYNLRVFPAAPAAGGLRGQLLRPGLPEEGYVHEQ